MHLKNFPRENRHKIFYLVMALIFTDTVLYGTIVPLIPIYMTEFHLNTSTIGFIFSAYALGVLLFSLPMGIIAERYGYQRVFLSGMAVLGLSCLSYAFVNNPWALFICRFIQGSASAASWTGGLAIVALLYPQQQGGKIGILMAIMGLGTILGPPIGGVLYHFLGYHLMFSFFALFCLILIFFIYHVDFHGIEINTLSLINNKKLRIFSSLKNPQILWFSMVVIVLASVFGMIEILMPDHMDRHFGLNTVQIGLSFGLMGVVHAISDAFSGQLSDRLGYEIFMLGGLIANALIIPLLAWAPNIFSLLIVLTMIGVATGAAVTPSQPLMYKLVLNIFPPGENCIGAGCIYGFYNTLYSVGMFLGPMLGGLLNNYFGLLISLLSFSLVFLLSGILFYFKIFLPREKIPVS